MKSNDKDLCRANVFIKTRTTNNDTIPDEDPRIVIVIVTFCQMKIDKSVHHIFA
nr:hypothetical protein [Tanacetum cinerariifolium]